MKPIINKLLMSVAFIFFSTLTVIAQSEISGKVTDAITNEPLLGANVVIKGTTTGTTTNFDGEFILSSSDDFPWTLEVSYIGFKIKEIIVESAQSNLVFTLDEDSAKLEEVIITANKRSQSAQKVPMSVSVLSPVKLQRSGAEEFKDYANGIPNLAFSPSGDGNSGRASTNVAIRGISGRNTTAMYLDETPLPENIDIRLLDVDRVEVLKGPQGTLYGSRNMGGAVKTITKSPNVTAISGSVKAEISTVKEGDQNYNLEGVLNLPLGDKLALRMSGFYDYESGIFDTRINRQANVANKDEIVTVTSQDGSETINIATDGCDICSETDRENIDDKTQYGFNISLGYYPTENISIIPKVIIQDLKGSGYDFAESDITESVLVDGVLTGVFPEGNFDQDRNSGIPETFTDKWKFYSLTGKIDTDFGSFISSTSFLDRDIFEKEDTGEITMPLFSEGFWDLLWNPSEGLYNTWAFYMSREVREKQFNQEVRFQSDFKGKFEFTAGAFYNSSSVEADWASEENGKGFISWVDAVQWDYFASPEEQETNNNVPIYSYDGEDKSTEFALFGEFYYNITPKLKATLGLRYFDAKTTKDVFDIGYTVWDGETFLEDGSPDYESSRTVIKGEIKESGVNPKFNLTYEIDDNKLIYANAAKGFRLGGVNDVVNFFLSSDELIELGYADGRQPATYESDYLWNYELGYKGKSKNGKWVTNVAVFYNDWQNLQQGKALLSGYSFTSNVGSARSYGLELEIRNRINENFTVAAGYGYLNAELSEDVPTLGASKGDKILSTAPHTGNISLDYNKNISNTKTLYGTAGYQFVGERVGSFQPEIDPHLVFGAYSILNARVGMQIKNYDIAVFGNNLTTTFANYGTPNAFSGDLRERPRYATNRPITVGVALKYFF